MRSKSKINKPIPKSFLLIFLEKRIASFYYAKIINQLTEKTILENSQVNKISQINKVHIIYDVPSYLKVDINCIDKGWKINKLITYKGSMIVLKNYQSIDTYLEKNLSSGRRSKLRTYQKRLYYSFNIEYKIYYGKITLKEYDFLFENLYKMINRRFIEKQTIHKDLKRWNAYYDLAYDLINKKEACLFVMLDGKKPISISLNLINNTLIYGYIRAFDIDYSKFYIGLLDIVKQLEWCFENKFEIFDLLKGDYGYKSHWTDDFYFFEKHILYNSNHFQSSRLASIITFKSKTFYKLFGYLKKLKIHLLYRRYQEFKNRQTLNLQNPRSKSQILFTQIPTTDKKHKYEKIDINKEHNSFILKALYTFLYANNEKLNDVVVFEVKKEIQYILKGKNTSQMLVLSSNPSSNIA